MDSMETELKQYQADETAGLLLRLPVPLGETVWRIQRNPACHRYVREAETFLYGKVVTPQLIVEPVSFTSHGGNRSHCQRRGREKRPGAVGPRHGQLHAECLRPHLRTDDEEHGGADAKLL